MSYPTHGTAHAAPSDRHPAILITGMSGVGKSTALAELARRGFTTVDTDHGPWIHTVDGESLWREPLMQDLLAQSRQTALFVQGTVANQGRFYDRFDAIVLLSAPAEVMFARLAARTTNPFGKAMAERQQIACDLAEVEPVLRVAATHEIDTTQSVSEVVDTLVSIARERISQRRAADSISVAVAQPVCVPGDGAANASAHAPMPCELLRRGSWSSPSCR